MFVRACASSSSAAEGQAWLGPILHDFDEYPYSVKCLTLDGGVVASSLEMKDSLVAGSVSGALTRLFTCPLDVLKIRFQLQLEPISQLSQSSKYRSVLDAVRTIHREEGIRAFWKGLFVGQVLYVVYSGTQFYTFDTCNRKLHKTFPNLHPSWEIVTNFGVGTVAGGVAAFACHPLDVIRTRFVGQGEPKIYPSVQRAIVMMYREKGIPTFYRGLLPSLMYTAAQAGLSFGFYHGYSKLLKHYVPFIHQSVMFPLCGAMAGICSKTIVLPFDLIKKRLAVQGFEEARRVFGRTALYTGAIHCFRRIVQEEGLLAFYKGTSPSIVKAGFSISLSFMFYEHTLHWLKSRHDDR